MFLSNVRAMSFQSCPTLCNPMNCSPPASSVPGILRAGIQERIAISFSRGSSRPSDQTRTSPALAGGFFTTEPSPKSYIYTCSVAESCPALFDPKDCNTSGFPVYHQLPGITPTHVHRVTDAIQPSHPLSSVSPALNVSQHLGVFP